MVNVQKEKKKSAQNLASKWAYTYINNKAKAKNANIFDMSFLDLLLRFSFESIFFFSKKNLEKSESF
jgi:hypothetical protein